MTLSLKSFLISLFCFFMMVRAGLAQVKHRISSTKDFEYGIGCKFTGTIEAGRPQINLSANAGMGKGLGSNLYASYNLQLQLYNGGHGTNFARPVAWPLTFDLAHSLMMTTGVDRAHRYMNEKKNADRNSPLYHFSDFTNPALQNPFQYSLSLGTNLIQAVGRGRKPFQRAGFINIHLDWFQFGYANDGTPFGFAGKLLCDGEDRYYTGDGFAALHAPRSWEVNTLLLSYHKFTGWYDRTFELGNLLFVANVEYKDTTQQYFNRSAYTLTVSNVARGLSLSGSLRNKYFGDIQHLIHRNDYWTMHQVPYPFRVGVSASLFTGTSTIKTTR